MNRSKEVPAPPWLALLEIRSLLELALHPLMHPFSRRLPQGEGQPVMVIPGWPMTALLSYCGGWLERLGYECFGWEQDRNQGIDKAQLQTLGGSVSV